MEFRRGRADDPAEPGTKVCATTEDVLIDNILRAEGIAVNSASFPPGTRTFYHSHDDGQLFFLRAGEGIVASRNGPARVVRAGDVVHAAPGEEHWHGASPECFVVYTSVSLGVTRFGDEVSDQDYKATWSTADGRG